MAKLPQQGDNGLLIVWNEAAPDSLFWPLLPEDSFYGRSRQIHLFTG
jgi:hypothetical protein